MHTQSKGKSKSITKAKTSVDDLFSKTDFTIAQSFTQLNDSVTKFVGEAGTGSGAAKTLASSIKLVADNVDTIANVATLGGVAFLTKAVISQTIAMRESIAASIQRRLSVMKLYLRRIKTIEMGCMLWMFNIRNNQKI